MDSSNTLKSKAEALKLKVKTPDAAGYTGVSEQYLRLKRMRGQTGGPPYYRIGKAVVYDVRDLDNWLERHRVED